MTNSGPTMYELRRNSAEFCKIDTLKHFCEHIRLPMLELPHLLQNLHYNEFTIPKKSGVRQIEDPCDPLKAFLRDLNYTLQSVYFHHRTPAAYGFMVVPDDDTDERNIRSNAQRHVNKPWMLNADFLDFFHAIKRETVFEIFLNQPFMFDEELADTLADICTYKGRLPMGSPTSPVLSNFATRQLDADLLEISKTNQWTYTRFADDLTFSANEPINHNHLKEIAALCGLHGFEFNENKIHVLSPSVDKMVTGLKVTDRVDVEDDFFPKLADEIAKYKHVKEIAFRTGDRNALMIERFEQEIQGFLTFAKYVSGPEHPDYRAAIKEFKGADIDYDSYDSVSWLEFNYLLK